jgi:hypothetical protein
MFRGEADLQPLNVCEQLLDLWSADDREHMRNFVQYIRDSNYVTIC